MRNIECTADGTAAVLVAVALAALAGCSGKQVTRADVDEQIDLSGEWNDTDSQQVSAALVTQITGSPWVEDFIAEHGKKPYPDHRHDPQQDPRAHRGQDLHRRPGAQVHQRRAGEGGGLAPRSATRSAASAPTSRSSPPRRP